MIIRIGLGSCGIAAGALKVKEVVEAEIQKRCLDIEVKDTGCIGMCHAEPLLDLIDDQERVFTYGYVTPEVAIKIFDEHIIGQSPVEQYLLAAPEKGCYFMEGQKRVALRNCGIINPEKLQDYVDHEGYQALKRVVTEMTPEEVISEIKESGLRGRGGAGFPAWFKWDAARKNSGDKKYVVCNADEGDPGAFMDRSLLEGDPHSVLEGMAIAGYAVEANQGFIYCRAEYPLAIRRTELAIKQAEEQGILGKNIFGSGFDFEISIKQGAGAFVCGEETALIASLEGERGKYSK